MPCGLELFLLPEFEARSHAACAYTEFLEKINHPKVIRHEQRPDYIHQLANNRTTITTLLQGKQIIVPFFIRIGAKIGVLTRFTYHTYISSPP